jgi:hypothetical protein
MSCENLATCIGPNLIRTADNDLRTMIMDTPAIMSLFSIFIRDALVLFHDCENLRPNYIRKKGKSLIEINKQMFTVHFSENEKKSILLNPGEILCHVLEKICNSRNMALETLTVLDGNRNPLPSLQMTLSAVEGRCVFLLTPPPLPPPLVVDIKTKSSDITLPRIKFPETSKDEFIFPLPSPLTELGHKSTADIPDVKGQSRKSIGKSISSSLINRGLSPRDNSQPELPVSAGHTPRFLDESSSPPEPMNEVKSVVGKEEKRKSWKNQLSKRGSEIQTKSSNNSNSVRSQIPPIHTNPSSKTLPTQNTKPKSELHVPSLLTSTNNQVCVDQKENKRTKARSVKKGKENLISGNNS